MKPGQVIRAYYKGYSTAGARIKYDPEWSPSLPFLCYWNGTALAPGHATLEQAMARLGDRETKWSDPS